MAFSDDQRWLRRFRPSSDAALRLLCFHHAGGGASAFRDWPRLLTRTIEPVAVQLPGREDRLAEPAYDRMEPLANALVTALHPLLRTPYACFGISMGARVALEFTRALHHHGLPLPQILFVASSPAPGLPRLVPDGSEPDEHLLTYIHDLGGTPTEVMSDPELLQLLLPALRADLAVLASHITAGALPVPIHAFAGVEDRVATLERMEPWRQETAATFRLDRLPGGHFLSPEGYRRMIGLIADNLIRTATSITQKSHHHDD